MGKYLDDIKAYDILGKISELKSKVEILKKEFRLDAADLEYYDRFNVVLEQVGIIIQTTNPYLITIQQTSDIYEKLTEIYAELQLITNDTFYDILDKVNELFNELIKLLSCLIVPSTKKQINGYRDSVIKLKQLVDTYATSIESNYDEIKKSLEETSATISEEKNKYDTLVSELKVLIQNKQDEMIDDITEKTQEFENRINSRIDDYETKIKQKINDFDKVMTLKRQEYEDELHGRLAELGEEMKGQYETFNEEWTKIFQESNNEIISQKERYLSEWGKHISDIEKVAGALAEHSMAYSFKQIADDERKSKGKWNLATIIGFCVLLIYGSSVFYISLTESFTWANLTGRLSLALGIGAFIAYSGRQVSIHGKVERYCRETEIELASLGPYFAEFKDRPEEIFKIRLSLADKFFGKGDIVSDSNGLIRADKKSNPVESFLTPETIKSLLELAKKLK